MTTVFVYGKKSDKRLTELITGTLRDRYTVVCSAGEHFFRTGSGYELFIADGEAMHISADVVILKENSVPRGVFFGDGTTIIANADAENQLKALYETECDVIICGGKSGTVSFSSNTADSVVVSLNRGFTALSGKEIQPLEIPVTSDGCDGYSVLAVTALRLLLDDFTSDIGQLY